MNVNFIESKGYLCKSFSILRIVPLKCIRDVSDFYHVPQFTTFSCSRHIIHDERWNKQSPRTGNKASGVYD